MLGGQRSGDSLGFQPTAKYLYGNTFSGGFFLLLYLEAGENSMCKKCNTWIWNRQSSIWKCLDRSSEKNSNNHFKTRWWPYLCDIPVTRCRRCLKSWRLKRWRRGFRPSSREPSRPYWTIGPFSPGTLSSKSCPSLVQTARHTHQTQALLTHSPTRPKQHPHQKHLCKNSGESPLSLLSGTLTFKGKT